MISIGFSLLLAAVVALPAPQQPVQGRSPIQDLLRSARTALNDLRYSDADSISRAILALSDTRRNERIQALELLAGALYPEQESAQRSSEAREALQRLVRIAPTATLSTEVSWAGLEQLHAEVRQATFGTSAAPRHENVVVGPDESVAIEVVASRPAAFSLWIQPDSGGQRLLLESVTGTQGTLRFRVLENGQPRFRSGAYNLLISSVDQAMADTIMLVFSSSINAPALDYVPIPTTSSTTPLPERTKPNRAAGIVGGIVALGSTIAMSTLFRSSELKDATGTDSRAVGIGLVLGVGTAVGAWFLDKGNPIPANVEANRLARSDFEFSVANARARNAELLRTYRAEVLINPEPRP